MKKHADETLRGQWEVFKAKFKEHYEIEVPLEFVLGVLGEEVTRQQKALISSCLFHFKDYNIQRLFEIAADELGRREKTNEPNRVGKPQAEDRSSKGNTSILIDGGGGSNPKESLPRAKNNKKGAKGAK